jgi:hypothetical protein
VNASFTPTVASQSEPSAAKYTPIDDAHTAPAVRATSKQKQTAMRFM